MKYLNLVISKAFALVEALAVALMAPLTTLLSILVIAFAYIFSWQLRHAKKPMKAVGPDLESDDDFGTQGERYEWLGGPTAEWLGA